MKQYNRIMLGEHGKYLDDCLAKKYIGVDFFKNEDLAPFSHDTLKQRQEKLVKKYLEQYPD